MKPETPMKRPPPQTQKLPGEESRMSPQPMDEDPEYVASGKLRGQVAIITGGDSGIGRAVALLYAREGASVCIVYLNEDRDAEETLEGIRKHGGRGLRLAGDIGEASFCERVVEETVKEFGRLDILVNNAATQKQISGVEDLVAEQVERTFRTNLFGFFYLTRAALPHLKEGAVIINNTSVQAYDPSPHLMDYACTKAGILNFTRSLARELAERKIRVNAVAPGPIWTPLIPASFSEEHVEQFGSSTLFERPGQTAEVAPSYVFLASQRDSSFITGQVIHANGGSAMQS